MNFDVTVLFRECSVSATMMFIVRTPSNRNFRSSDFAIRLFASEQLLASRFV